MVDYDKILKESADFISTLFRDFFMGFAFLAVVLFILILQLPHEKSKNNKDNIVERGNLRAEIFWDDKLDIDIDLWCKAPNDVPVGFSHNSGLIFNLLRDDLGKVGDISNRNYELCFSRGLPNGEWIFNIHFFRNDWIYPKPSVTVNFVLTKRKNDSSDSSETSQQVIAKTITLTRTGEEVTMVRFKMDNDGNIIENSINFIPISLISVDSREGLGNK